jgi:hypothetical protein
MTDTLKVSVHTLISPRVRALLATRGHPAVEFKTFSFEGQALPEGLLPWVHFSANGSVEIGEDHYFPRGIQVCSPERKETALYGVSYLQWERNQTTFYWDSEEMTLPQLERALASKQADLTPAQKEENAAAQTAARTAVEAQKQQETESRKREENGKVEERQRQENEKAAKEQAQEDACLAWAKEHGSELLKARIEGDFEWRELCIKEIGDAIINPAIEAGFKKAFKPRHYETAQFPTLEQLKAADSIGKLLPDCDISLIVEIFQPDEDDEDRDTPEQKEGHSLPTYAKVMFPTPGKGPWYSRYLKL